MPHPQWMHFFMQFCVSFLLHQFTLDSLFSLISVFVMTFFVAGIYLEACFLGCNLLPILMNNNVHIVFLRHQIDLLFGGQISCTKLTRALKYMCKVSLDSTLAILNKHTSPVICFCLSCLF
jgi:hypothetical protein